MIIESEKIIPVIRDALYDEWFIRDKLIEGKATAEMVDHIRMRVSVEFGGDLFGDDPTFFVCCLEQCVSLMKVGY